MLKTSAAAGAEPADGPEPALRLLLLGRIHGPARRLLAVLRRAACEVHTGPISAAGPGLAGEPPIDLVLRCSAPEALRLPRRLLVDGCELDLIGHSFQRGGARGALVPRESSLLAWLYLHGGEVSSRDDILEHVFGQRRGIGARAVDMAVLVLREKIERDRARPRIIQTVRGRGYTWGPAWRGGS